MARRYAGVASLLVQLLPAKIDTCSEVILRQCYLQAFDGIEQPIQNRQTLP
jgi:hypothetical protein